MQKHRKTYLTPAQQEILDGIQINGGEFKIPSYRLGQTRSARLLERNGYVDVKRTEGGTLSVTLRREAR